MTQRLRFGLLALAGLSLLCGLWVGLARIGWQWPSPSPAMHGPLMISGFLGALVSLERAVAFRRRWAYLPPLLAGGGAILIIGGAPEWLSCLVIELGSVVLLCIFAATYWQHYGRRLEPAALTMLSGVACWSIGNFLWLLNRPLYQVVAWWVAFLLLTIAGERLELARVQLLRRASAVLFVASAGCLIAGLAVSLLAFAFGLRLAGVGVLALGVWLLTFDVARRTIRQSGLTQYIAACLLPGYAWLVIGGAFWWLWADYFVAGPFYDAMLHTILLGFVFSMIFGHAPLIMPALTGMPIPFKPRFYLHLIMLHLSLVLRLAGDLAALPELRAWGGLLNALTIVLFLGSTLWAARSAGRVKTAPALT